jgi:hypothetical protein
MLSTGLLGFLNGMNPVELLKAVARRGNRDRVTVFLWLAFALSLGFFLVNADRGFEITDEGLALVAASHPEDVKVAPFAFAYTASLLYDLAGGDPAWFRRVGALVLVASAGVLAWGVALILPEASLAALFPMAGLGALVFMSPGLTMPNYNLIASCGLVLGMAFFLAIGSTPDARRARLLSVLSGAGLAFAGLAKPPGGVAVSCLLLVIALLGMIRVRFGFWVLGAALVLAQQLVRQGGDAFFQMLVDGVTFNRLVGEAYGPGAVLSRYASEAWALFILTIKTAAPTLIAALVAKRLAPGLQPSAPVWMCGILAITLFATGNVSGGHRLATSGQTTAAILASLLVAGTSAFLGQGKEEPRTARTRVVTLLLLLAPFVSLIGTNTPLGFSVLFFCAPWFLIPATLEAPERPHRRVVSLLMAVLAANWIISAPYVAPYRRATPMGEQTISVQVGVKGSRLRVDPVTARFLRSYRAAAATCGVRAGDPILAFSWTPGLVWAVGGRTMAITHFVHDFFPGARPANEFALARIPPDVQERAFVIHTTRGARVHPTLLLGRRRFPADYRLCFEGEWPVNRDEVRLYAPLPGS